jgi:hypothetical protein
MRFKPPCQKFVHILCIIVHAIRPPPSAFYPRIPPLTPLLQAVGGVFFVWCFMFLNITCKYLGQKRQQSCFCPAHLD